MPESAEEEDEEEKEAEADQCVNPTEKVQASSFPYTLIDNADALSSFLNTIDELLKDRTHVENRIKCFFDSEGKDLGRIGGKLGLIQIGLQYPIKASSTPDKPEDPELRVYLIDIIIIPEPDLLDLWRVLGDTRLLKIVWDGRMDVTELSLGHTCTLHPLLDLQLLDLLHHRYHHATHPLYVHALRGLRKTVTELRLLTREEEEEVGMIDLVVKTAHLNNESSLWLHRPLDGVMCQYASLDVFCLAKVWRYFRERGAVRVSGGEGEQEGIEERELVRKSGVFAVSDLDAGGRKSKDDRFRNHGFLPIGILEESGPSWGCLMCVGCKRTIDAKWFHPIVFSKHPSTRLCPVCARIKQRSVPG